MSPLPPLSRERCPHCGAPRDACRCGLDPWPFAYKATIAVTVVIGLVVFYLLVTLLDRALKG